MYLFFFVQAEDGIRDAQESRGLGDVYKRQELVHGIPSRERILRAGDIISIDVGVLHRGYVGDLSLIHI